MAASTVKGLTVVPLSSFKLTIDVLTKGGHVDEFFDALKEKGTDEIYLSYSVMQFAQLFLKEKSQAGTLSAAVEPDAVKIIECAGCCNGCTFPDD